MYSYEYISQIVFNSETQDNYNFYLTDPISPDRISLVDYAEVSQPKAENRMNKTNSNNNNNIKLLEVHYW